MGPILHEYLYMLNGTVPLNNNVLHCLQRKYCIVTEYSARETHKHQSHSAINQCLQCCCSQPRPHLQTETETWIFHVTKQVKQYYVSVYCWLVNN